MLIHLLIGLPLSLHMGVGVAGLEPEPVAAPAPAPAAAAHMVVPMVAPSGGGRRFGFAAAEDLKVWTLEATGDAKKRMPLPKVEEGHLTLLDTWWRSSGAAALNVDATPGEAEAAPAPTPAERKAPPRSLRVEWTAEMSTGTEGLGFAWLDTATYGQRGVPEAMKPEDSRDPGANSPAVEIPAWGWEAPNLRHAFGIGMDALNPVNHDPFRGSGNANDRPQHELSLHWDGMEIVKRTTPKDFRDGKPHKVVGEITFVTGGAEVSVALDDEAMFERYFVPGMVAFTGRPVFGARNGETAGEVHINSFAMETAGESAAGESTEPAAPTTVAVFSKILNDKDHGTTTATVELPADVRAFGRIIATLRLDKPETRFDPWDRLAHVWVEDVATGQRVELLRYITPYHRGYEWQVDVSDLRPMLSGSKRFVHECGTYGEGWVVSVRLDYYPGQPPAASNSVPAGASAGGPALVAREVINLWCGSPVIGDPARPPAEFYADKSFTLQPWVKAAKLRITVTGHGQAPNTDNAAEFMPIERTVTANGKSFANKLWKTDVYLNPCRPQGGTWKYDRAGWAPGDVVTPWVIDLTPVVAELGAERVLKLGYALGEYINAERGKGGDPTHVTQCQLVLFGEPPVP